MCYDGVLRVLIAGTRTCRVVQGFGDVRFDLFWLDSTAIHDLRDLEVFKSVHHTLNLILRVHFEVVAMEKDHRKLGRIIRGALHTVDVLVLHKPLTRVAIQVAYT